MNNLTRSNQELHDECRRLTHKIQQLESLTLDRVLQTSLFQHKVKLLSI
jgi:hypothetical protein